MTFSSASRTIFILLSCITCLIAIALLVVCLFSADYRYVGDTEVMRGTRTYGLLRYCFQPERTTGQSDDSNEAVCYLRTKAPANEVPINYKQHYGPFEMTTLVLLSIAAVCGLASLCFAICTILSKFGAFASSISVLAAAICAFCGFGTYTYFNELRENQTEKISGNLFLYHYGWAYYCTGAAAGVLVLSFIFSLLGSAFECVHSSERKREKLESNNFEMGNRGGTTRL